MAQNNAYDLFDVIQRQLVLGCTAIHEQHGFKSDAGHDCRAPEADAALATLREQAEQLKRERDALDKSDSEWRDEAWRLKAELSTLKGEAES